MRTAALAVFCLALGACAHARRREPEPPPTPPRVTHAPGDHPFDFSADQTVETAVRGRPLVVRVVIEKVGDRLTLVGLTPFGVRAYAVVQDGLDVDAEVHLDGELPFAPALVLADVHRTFLAGFPAGNEAPRDGTRAFVRGGDRFVDTIVAGEVRSRRVTPADPRAEPIEILYAPEPMPLDGTPPRRVLVRHERSGYELVITTTAYRRASSP